MFRLKKLEIQGFKSFVDKTSLTLPSRITAIVGPNGSGKSNICDAVQWVLGEQSARVLRGTTMEDVIFNGSARRRPLGLAEVSLTLEARNDEYWAEHGGEVTITRRVTRDGESDYVLNGKRSRLKDIQEILFGTGLGVRAYSIIEQQKVDLILSTKPQDRRRLIEEAAGVSKYKIRKRQAEVKLEETRANLLRLHDLVSEIERSCASLKRQASRAARWKEQSEVLVALKKRLARLRADPLTALLKDAEIALGGQTDEESAALAALGRAEADLQEAIRRADADERSRRELAEAAGEAQKALLSADASVAAAAREAEEAQARQQLLESQRSEAEADHLRSGEASAPAGESRSSIAKELSEAETLALTAAKALVAAAEAENERTSRRETSRRELLSAAARSAEATNREREAGLLADRLGFALGKLEERKKQTAAALAERDVAVAAAREAEETSARALEEARERLDETGIGRKAAEEKLSLLKSERDAAVASFHALDRKLAALETTLAEREAGGEAARRALEGSNLSADGVLADHFEARAGFEKALDAALGAALEAPVLGTRESLETAIAAVREAKLGTARFVHPIPETPFPLKPHDERVLGVSRELLTPREGDEALSSALPDAIVVGSVADALALAPLHPERTIVSTDGVVVRGSIVEAAGTALPGEGLFTVRRELKDLGHEREALANGLAALEEAIDGTRTLSGELTATMDRDLATCRRAEREHSEAAARRSAAEEERRRTAREADTLHEEAVALARDLARAGESRAEAALVAAQRAGGMASV